MYQDKLKRLPFIAHANTVFKAYLQERKAARSLVSYQQLAQRTGLVCPDGKDLERALRKRLASRGIKPIRNRPLHIFLAYYVENWERVLPQALTPFGRISEFEWRSEGFDDTAADWLQHRDGMNSAMLDAFFKAGREQPVDVVVGYLSGYNTAPETLKVMVNSGAAIFNFCWDDTLEFPGRKVGGRYSSPAALADVVDLNLTSKPSSLVKYAVHGGLAMFWPEAAYPSIHRRYALPFEFDVTFVGACYGWRPTFIARLAKLGVKVECFGRGWPNGPVSELDMVRLYSKSRINLGFSGIGYSRNVTTLKGRDFEVPMSGGLYLTQDHPDLALVFDVGSEIVTYTDEADCAVKIKELLADPIGAASIRCAGQARCLREHTYEARWMKIFSMAGILPQNAITLSKDGSAGNYAAAEFSGR